MAGGWWYKPNIGHNSNSTLGGVELTWSGDGVEIELGVELELGNIIVIICSLAPTGAQGVKMSYVHV